MVNQINHRGFRDWLAQRLTAVLIGSYAIFIIAYLLSSKGMTYLTWSHLFNCVWIRIYTVVALLSVLWHAWIGLWTVLTDYVKPKCLRLFLEACLFLLLAIYMVWCLDILWA